MFDLGLKWKKSKLEYTYMWANEVLWVIEVINEIKTCGMGKKLYAAS